MNLGASMDIRFEETVEEFLEYITDLGLSHLEIKREYVHGHPETPTPTMLGELIDQYEVSLTLHAPFRDWNTGSFNDVSRRASVEQVKATLDDAAKAGAGAVILHGGSVPRRYPAYVQRKAVENARKSLRECARYAAERGVSICLENQPHSESKLRHTTTAADLGLMLESVGMDGDALGVTLDVGHAKLNDQDPLEYVERFNERIQVVHLHDNDGTSDQHKPLLEYEPFVDAVDAEYFVFEMKSVADIARCLGAKVETGQADD